MYKNERRNHDESNGMDMSLVIRMRSFVCASLLLYKYGMYPPFSNLSKV
jgi:hypothetical protein